MKIGLVTIFNVHNYGAMLQCYSHKTFLESLGHEVVLFEISFIKRNILNNWLFNNVNYAFHRHFVNNYLPFTGNLSTPVDLYMVGSDQVWNPAVVGNEAIKHFMLDFAKSGIPKVAYASSLGVEKWITSEADIWYKSALNSFSQISVREQSGTTILKENFGIDAKHVLDPCFLVPNLAQRFIKGDSFPSNRIPRFVTYKLHFNVDSWSSRAIALTKKYNCEYIDISAKYFVSCFKHTLRGLNVNYLSVEDWLSSIFYADYIITDSFHGMVFSILFKKQFLIVSNNKVSTRIDSLLSKLDLMNRKILSFDDAEYIFHAKKIDYDIVFSKLMIEIENSRSVLIEMLQKNI